MKLIFKTVVHEIFQLLPKFLAVKFVNLTESLLEEVKKEYTKTLSEHSIASMTVPSVGEVRKIHQPLKPE